MSDDIPITELCLSTTVLSKLVEAGYIYKKDFLNVTPIQLGPVLGLPIKKCAEILDRILKSNSIKPSTAMGMIMNEEDVSHVVTFCKEIDNLLGGGFQVGSVTDIFGAPGTGKTQLCLQASVSAQLPASVGGIGGEVLFVDTEGSFSGERLKEIADWAVQLVRTIAGVNSDVLQCFTMESIFKGFHYFRCQNLLQTIAVIKKIIRITQQNLKIRLIVIDSIAFHFRYDFFDTVARAGILYRLTGELMQQATKNNIAIIFTNHLTTRLEKEGSSHHLPSLGDSWSHCPNTKLHLFWEDMQRKAKLTKAPHRSSASVNYQITEAGVRDVFHKRNQSSEQDSKRQKT